MKLQEKILRAAKETISTEAKAIANLEHLLDNEFVLATEKIYNSRGKLVVTGIGKSAIVANKIVATLNSTGTSAISMHANAINGNLGNIKKEDVVICISKSGNSPEIKVLVPYIKSFQNSIIGITSDKASFLGRNADFMINTFVEEGTCPNTLVSATSTHVQMVMGNALAMCLLKLKEFSCLDVAKYHPGSLKKRLYPRPDDITTQYRESAVNPETSVTDGDIRRILKKTSNFSNITARDIMGENPIEQDALAVGTLELLEKNKTSQLLAIENNKYIGVVHIHNLISEGIL